MMRRNDAAMRVVKIFVFVVMVIVYPPLGKDKVDSTPLQQLIATLV